LDAGSLPPTFRLPFATTNGKHESKTSDDYVRGLLVQIAFAVDRDGAGELHDDANPCWARLQMKSGRTRSTWSTTKV
jgi:hypothetical protein